MRIRPSGVVLIATAAIALAGPQLAMPMSSAAVASSPSSGAAPPLAYAGPPGGLRPAPRREGNQRLRQWNLPAARLTGSTAPAAPIALRFAVASTTDPSVTNAVTAASGALADGQEPVDLGQEVLPSGIVPRQQVVAAVERDQAAVRDQRSQQP